MEIGETFRYVRRWGDTWNLWEGVIRITPGGRHFTFATHNVPYDGFSSIEEAAVSSKASAPLMPVYEAMDCRRLCFLTRTESPTAFSRHFRKLYD